MWLGKPGVEPLRQRLVPTLARKVFPGGAAPLLLSVELGSVLTE